MVAVWKCYLADAFYLNWIKLAPMRLFIYIVLSASKQGVKVPDIGVVKRSLIVERLCLMLSDFGSEFKFLFYYHESM